MHVGPVDVICHKAPGELVKLIVRRTDHTSNFAVVTQVRDLAHSGSLPCLYIHAIERGQRVGVKSGYPGCGGRHYGKEQFELRKLKAMAGTSNVTVAVLPTVTTGAWPDAGTIRVYRVHECE